jgi:hypothetical protein
MRTRIGVRRCHADPCGGGCWTFNSFINPTHSPASYWCVRSPLTALFPQASGHAPRAVCGACGCGIGACGFTVQQSLCVCAERYCVHVFMRV